MERLNALAVFLDLFHIIVATFEQLSLHGSNRDTYTTFTLGTVIPFRSVPFHNRSAELFHSAFALIHADRSVPTENTKIWAFPKARVYIND